VLKKETLGMVESKEQKLWQACTDGDLETVKELASDPAVDVNWVGEDRGDTPLHRACRFGYLEIVTVLLAQPKIGVNKGNRGDCSPFYIACQEGHRKVISLLRADPRIDPNRPNTNEATPFFMACQEGQTNVVSLLLADPRIDLNKQLRDQGTPLWYASQLGQLVVVQHLLASGREIDTRMKSTFNNNTAAEQGRQQPSVPKSPEETEEDFQKRKTNGPLCAALLDEHESDHVAVQHRLRRQPGLREYFIGHLFALAVFHSDSFAVINEITARSDTKRFFMITSRLPLDLQMVLCNRVFGSPKDIIISRSSEPGFQLLARATTWRQ